MTAPNYVAILAILNAMLRRVSTALPRIEPATRGFPRDETPSLDGVSANGLGKASA